jgi:hypothetical protein
MNHHASSFDRLDQGATVNVVVFNRDIRANRSRSISAIEMLNLSNLLDRLGSIKQRLL